MVTAADRARRVRELLDGGEAWTQGEFAKNERGFPVKPNSEQACAWCLSGAILAVEPIGFDVANAVYYAIKKLYPDGASFVIRWNDEEGREWPEVEAVLLEAEKTLEGAE